jgi:hypothetical protein
MPNVDAATVARWVLGWGRVRGDQWRVRLDREEAERARAVREAEEEEKAREAREVATARDKVTVGEGFSERGEKAEIQGGPSKGGIDEEGSADPGASVEKGADGGKDTGEVEIEEVEGVKLGPAWDARDLSRRLGSGDIQVSKSCFPFLNVDS